MKLKFLIFGCLATSLISMDPPLPPLLFSLEESSVQSRSLQDFFELKNRAGKLCKIAPKSISPEFQEKILRVHSEGEVDKLDCESINNLIRIECSQAAGLLASLGVSRSIMSSNLAQESYDKACGRYRNAFLWIIKAFNLKCFKTLDKLHEVLTAFTEAEQTALRENRNRRLDPQTQGLYDPLEKIILKAEKKELALVPVIPTENTKELLQKLEVPRSPSHRPKITDLSKKSLDSGNSHLKAGRDLLKSLQDPTIESYNTIEITFFIALEHFITAYIRDVNQGLENAETALAELEAVNELKKNKFGKVGQRFALAKEKLANARNPNSKSSPMKEKESIFDEPSQSTTETTSHRSDQGYSLEKYLQDDATAQKTAPSSEDVSHVTTQGKKAKPQTPSPVNSARSEESKLHESERAVKEIDEIDSGTNTETVRASERTTPFSLLTYAWKSCKKAGKGTGKGIKHLWNKLPFN
jgi:hypothetical protein